MTRAVIVDAIRSPMGRAHKGSTAQLRPDDLGAWVVRQVLERNPAVEPALIDDVIVANAMPEAEQGMNLGRTVAQLAGLPDSVPGMTVNRFCASGLEAIALACNKVDAGVADIVLAVGAESMSYVPLGGYDFRPNPTLARERPGYYLGMGLTAENLAQKYDISREQADEFAVRSHQRAAAAHEKGLWDAERIPLPLGELLHGDQPTLERDELTRPDTNLETLAKLPPAFRAGGTVTAGNSSPLTDGASVCLVTSEAKAKELGLAPMGRLVSYAAAGVDPEYMGIGPVAAVPKALEKAGWKLEDIETIELNEAFAAQSLAVMKELDLDEERTNPLGGAIALGHPLGCSGNRLAVTLLHHMGREKQTKGLVTMCVGGGMGGAGCFERL